MDKKTQRKLGKEVIDLKVALAKKLTKLTDKEKTVLTKRSNTNDGRN